MEYRVRRGGLVWPMILIGAGVLFLLNNLGIVGWSVWGTLLQLWPVLLIAIGLDILVGRRSAWGSLAVGVLVLVVLGAAVYLGVPQRWNPASQVVSTQNISQTAEGVTQANVDLGFGAGELTIQDAPESASLVEGTINLSSGEVAQPQFSRTGDTVRFTLHSQMHQVSYSWPNEQSWQGKTWNLRFSRDVPMSLSVDTGVGKANIDLTWLKITNLRVNTGVGNTNLTLPRSGKFSAQVDGGIGGTNITIPAGVAARIQVDRGLTGIEVNGQFSQNGDMYTSGDWNTAESRVDLRVHGGIGKITITQQAEG